MLSVSKNYVHFIWSDAVFLTAISAMLFFTEAALQIFHAPNGLIGYILVFFGFLYSFMGIGLYRRKMYCGMRLTLLASIAVTIVMMMIQGANLSYDAIVLFSATTVLVLSIDGVREYSTVNADKTD